jgi:hypothetical protein
MRGIDMNVLKVYYGMYGVEIVIEIDEKEVLNCNVCDYIGIGENCNEERFEGEWEINNRICWGFILGMIKMYDIEKVFDSENDSLDNVDEYIVSIKEYMNDDIKNYY